MNEKDFIILSILSKKKSISKDVLKLISSMNNKEKIKLIKYLYIMTFKYDIIPSDERIIKEILKIKGNTNNKWDNKKHRYKRFNIWSKRKTGNAW